MLVFFDAKDQVPAHLRDKATETEDGKFKVEVAGAEELHDVSGLKKALESEREAGRQAKKEAEDLAKKFGDLDPERAREALKKAKELEEEQARAKGNIDELVKQRVEERTQKMRSDHEAEVNALKEQNTELKASLDKKTGTLRGVFVDTAITKALDKNGIKVKKGALGDVLTRAHGTWFLDENDELVAKDGDKPAYGADGKALTLDEWVESTYKGASHLFEESRGGGGQPGDGGSPGGKKTISRSDKKAFNENLDGIASGEVVLTD